MNTSSGLTMRTFQGISLFGTLLEPALIALNACGIRLPDTTVGELALALMLKPSELRRAARFEGGGPVQAKRIGGRMRGIKR